MGTNRRYGSDVQQDTLNEFLLRPHPISLTPEEIGQKDVPETTEPIDVEAWVRFSEASIRVRGRAIAWNDRAVLVEFELRNAGSRRAWVWASAVERPGNTRDNGERGRR